MTAHDPKWVEAGARASALWHRGETVTDSDDYALAIEVVRAVEPLIRADEREQVGRVWAKREDLLLGDIEVARADERAALNGKLLRLYTQNTHAEAVAAKLVEVICERDERVGYWHRRWDFAQGQMDAMGASLLAARADAIRYSDEIDRMVRELSSIRMEHAAEVAALREQVDGYEAIARGMVAQARREALADLRAKVEELRDEAKADPVGSAVWRTTAYGAVLALIEEAGR